MVGWNLKMSGHPKSTNIFFYSADTFQLNFRVTRCANWDGFLRFTSSFYPWSSKIRKNGQQICYFHSRTEYMRTRRRNQTTMGIVIANEKNLKSKRMKPSVESSPWCSQKKRVHNLEIDFYFSFSSLFFHSHDLYSGKKLVFNRSRENKTEIREK